jgi:hypothetical protein
MRDNSTVSIPVLEENSLEDRVKDQINNTLAEVWNNYHTNLEYKGKKEIPKRHFIESQYGFRTLFNIYAPGFAMDGGNVKGNNFINQGFGNIYVFEPKQDEVGDHENEHQFNTANDEFQNRVNTAWKRLYQGKDLDYHGVYLSFSKN